MDIPLIDKLETFLNYDILGLIALILFIFFVLLLYVIKKKDMKTPVINIIKPFMYFVLALIVIFFLYKLLDKPSAKEWSIKGNIELQDRNKTVLLKILKDSCGKPLSEGIPLQDFLDKQLKIIILPNLISKSFGSSRFTASIPENLGKDNLEVLFQVDGFRCSSQNTQNCIRELNSSNYNLDLKTMIFIQDKPDKEECASQSTVRTH